MAASAHPAVGTGRCVARPGDFVYTLACNPPKDEAGNE